jgi:hypothetical protein
MIFNFLFSHDAEPIQLIFVYERHKKYEGFGFMWARINSRPPCSVITIYLLNDDIMKYKLLLLLVLFTLISACSFIQEERTVLKLSSDGKKLVSTTEDYEPEDIEDADEPPELEISNPMPLRELTDREMSASERSFPEMPVREMSLPEMPVREMPLRDN